MDEEHAEECVDCPMFSQPEILMNTEHWEMN